MRRQADTSSTNADAVFRLQVLEKDVDINMRDGDGATPLHFAASRGHTQMVRWLLRHGSKIVLDKYGKSPINDAAENERIEVGWSADGAELMDSEGRF